MFYGIKSLLQQGIDFEQSLAFGKSSWISVCYAWKWIELFELHKATFNIRFEKNTTLFCRLSYVWKDFGLGRYATKKLSSK
jgi:hypothetical protein